MHQGKFASHCTINGGGAFASLVVNGNVKEVKQTNAVGCRLPRDGGIMNAAAGIERVGQ